MATCREEGIGRKISNVAKDLDIDLSNRDVGTILTLPVKEDLTPED